MVLECIPIWAFQYFPSLDGPSHLHNASVLAHYDQELVYRQYYLLDPFPLAGNMLTHFVLAAFLTFMPPLLAEKLLLSLYVVLLFLSFRYLLGAVTPHADQFALFAGILAPNYFFYLGFWNFCFGVCLLALATGFLLRRQHWTPGALLLLMFASFMIYLTHAVPWAVFVTGVAVVGLQRAFSFAVRKEARWRKRVLTDCALPLCAVTPPAVLLLSYLRHSHGTPACAVANSLRERLWYLYSVSFLRSAALADHLVLVKAAAGALLLTTLCGLGVALWRRKSNWSSSGILALSMACAAVTVAGPDCTGSGSYIRNRMALLAWLFLVVWLASSLSNWPRIPLNVIASLFCAIAVAFFLTSIPFLSEWNGRLSKFASLGDQIHRGSTVLMVNLDSPSEDQAEPYLHAVGLFSDRGVVDLKNYEASTDYFLTRFRPERSPFPALGTLAELDAHPPTFNISRYEKTTQGRVDYLLFVSRHGSAGQERIEDLVNRLYRDQIAAFSPVPISESLRADFRLYQHDQRPSSDF
jgi:hypothetical protein